MSRLSQVLWSNAEQLLSADVNRAYLLTSREVTNLLRELLRDGDGTARGGILGVYPTVSGVVATFTAAVSGGFSGFVLDDAGATGDVGSYRVVRGPTVTTTLTFAAPEASPRIDLVVVGHGTADSNPLVRNVLTDPVARTVVPLLVNKDRGPSSTLSVLKGTAAPSPVRPAVLTGSLALFEVFVPAAAADAVAFSYSRAAPVLASRPANELHGGREGVPLRCSRGTNDAGGISVPFVAGLQVPVVWIDGERLRRDGLATAVENDALGDPLAALNLPPLNGGAPALGAAAVFGRAAYLYAYGGRRNPHPRGFGLVLSTTAPRLDGTPSAALRVSPYGSGTTDVQAGAVFLAPVHVGNANGAGTFPDFGGGAVLQQSWTSDGVLFPYPIAVWDGAFGGGNFNNLGIPALVGGSVTTTLDLATGLFLPTYAGTTTEMVSALLLRVTATAITDAGNVPTGSAFVDVHRVGGVVGVGQLYAGGRRWELHGRQAFSAGSQSVWTVDGERWFERSALPQTAPAWAVEALVLMATGFGQVGGAIAGSWSSMVFEAGVIGYKLNISSRGRL